MVVGQYHAYQIASHSRPDLRGLASWRKPPRAGRRRRSRASWIVIGRYLRMKPGWYPWIGPTGQSRVVQAHKKAAGSLRAGGFGLLPG
ncbi:hypothetical protein DF135_38090 [Burkholderia cepacia]|nr:hypothetical protein DF135_38090 [Burkholderia cepacia]